MLKSVTAIAIAFALFCVSFAPSSARAVPVDVTYSLQISVFSLAANQVVLNGPGTLTVRFANGTSLGHVSAGSLHVQGGTAMLSNSIAIPTFGVFITGTQSVVFGGSGMGAVDSLGNFTLMTTGHITSGFVHCAGALCSFLPTPFPNSIPVPLTSSTRPVTINLGLLIGFPSVGPQSFVANGYGGKSSSLLSITGMEISRQVVPEPGTGLLLGLGLAGFGIAGGTWRARRRRG